MSLHVALVHHPVYSRDGRVVTTAIANMDIHDIARACATYGVKSFYIINPEEEQRRLASSLISHWLVGYGAKSNPFRKRAFESIKLAVSLQETVADLEINTEGRVEIAVTGAALDGNLVSWAVLRKILHEKAGTVLLLFGTGSGLVKELTATADYRLEPLLGPTDYNHLSVRSAVSISLDRLLGLNRP